MGRRFPPPGVKVVASQGWAIYTRGVDIRGRHDFDNPNALLSEGGAPRRCGRKLPRNAASLPSLSRLAPSRPPSWEREKGAAGVMGGQGRAPPSRGFEGAGAPRQPQCITLGRLAPRPSQSAARGAARPPQACGGVLRASRLKLLYPLVEGRNNLPLALDKLPLPVDKPPLPVDKLHLTL